MAGNKLVSFNDDPPAGKDVKNTSHKNTTAREMNTTGKNSTKRRTVSHSPFGKLGAKGHPK